MELGYTLSSEEHGPLALAGHASRAEEAGFRFALISDHFHPWTDRQGESPFVWGVLGAVACTTERLVVGTGVTCPIPALAPSDHRAGCCDGRLRCCPAGSSSGSVPGRT